MAVPNALTTNEVKDSAGTEVEFTRISTSGRSTVFAKNGETPNAPHRLTISHQESGTGANAKRRSVVRFDYTVTGVSLAPRRASAYMVLEEPFGDVTTHAASFMVIANLLSFCATTGAASTVLFNCTGYGADALLTGGL